MRYRYTNSNKKEVDGSHDHGQQYELLGALSNYGVVPSTSGEKTHTIAASDKPIGEKSRYFLDESISHEQLTVKYPERDSVLQE